MNHEQPKQPMMIAEITAQLHSHLALIQTISQEPYLTQIEELSRRLIASYQRGGKMVLFGNGGSAADAQHVAAEMVSRFKRERPALPALALTVNTSILTAIGNDYAYDRVFARQVEALIAADDVAIGLTTSGRSPNVVAALKLAKARGAWTVAFTGKNSGPAGEQADFAITIPTEDTPRVQEAHITILHIVCDLVEAGVFGG